MRRISLTAAGVSLAVLSIAAQDPPPTFRSAVDVIAVDVQVVDRTGAPVANLGPDQFEVTIDGKTRRVVTANLVGIDPPEAAGAPGVPAPATVPPRAAPDEGPGRVYILAFDAMSFSALGVEPARDAARQFVSQLRTNDLVGLIVLPHGPSIDVTGNRGQILTALSQVIGQARTIATGQFQLSPSDLADLSREDLGACDFTDVDPLACIRRIDPLATDKILGFCRDPDPSERRFCIRNLLLEGKTNAQFEEADIVERLTGLRTLMGLLGQSAQRKVVVLVSAGVLSTDRSGGRPDVGDVGRLVGQTAAQANAAVYTLFIDRERSDQSSASRRAFRPGESSRDSTLLSRPLEQIAAASGGAFFRVVQGGGEFAFDRILKETSAYYLLGVQPEPRDRDGRSHQLQVKVRQRDLTVRGRLWVTLPKAGTPLRASSAPLAGPPPPKPLPESIRSLAVAYGRGEYDAVSRNVAAVRNLAAVLQDVQQADYPWQDGARRGLAFALELALTGLGSRDGFARDEAVRLLTQTHARVEQLRDEPFVCAWLRLEASGLQNIWAPDLSLPYVARAARRCPSDPRLSLARGVILEQKLGDGTDPARVREIAAVYAEAAQGESAVEAAVRTAWLAVRHDAAQQAVASLQALTAPSPDPYVRYTYAIVQGHALRDVGRADAAEAAYRRALVESPGAQSARIALLTLLLNRGQNDEAQALAEAVQAASRDVVDPWWTYSRGDGRIFSALLVRLRELAQ